MFKSGLSTMLASMALAMQSGGSAMQVTASPAPRPSRRALRSAPSMAYQKKSGTLKYPEQSERQANRGQRRAQGGPGI